MFGDRFSSSTNCSRWLHETEPGRPNQSFSCCFLKVATHPLGVLTISTHGRGDLLSGSVKVTSDRPIGGVLRFDLPDIGVAGVGASQPVRDAIFPARRQAGGISTAAAIHNLGAEAMVVSCRLMKDGAVLEEEEIPLAANGQDARYSRRCSPAPIHPISWGRCAAPRQPRGKGCSPEWPWSWMPATGSSRHCRSCRSRDDFPEIDGGWIVAQSIDYATRALRTLNQVIAELLLLTRVEVYFRPAGYGVGHFRAPHAIDQERLEIEMPGKSEIMRAVRDGLDNLEVDDPKGDTEWTKAVKTKLCKIGREFGCKVGAGGVDNLDYGEWLYDVTWLEYERESDDFKWPSAALIKAPLVAECEWGRGNNLGYIVEDFEKLLLARADVRLMIFDGNHEPGSRRSPDGLLGRSGSSTAPAPRMLGCWRPGKGVMTTGDSGISRLR